MPVSLKHQFTSAIPDSTDPSLIQPSNWNAEHTLTLASDRLLGRASAGTGAVEEITLTAAGRALLDDASASAQRTTLGVGTSDSPTFAGLSLTGALSTTGAITSTGETTINLVFQSNTTFSNGFNVYKRGTTGDANAAVTSGSEIGYNQFLGWNGSSYNRGAYVFVGADEDQTATNGGMHYRIHTASTGTTSALERMRIRGDGNIGIGTSGSASANLQIFKNITGASASHSLLLQGSVQSDVVSAYVSRTYVNTAAASFTLSNLFHYAAEQGGAFGAGSTVTNQYGFFNTSVNIGATNNYAFFAGNTEAVTAGRNAFGFYSNINIATGGGTTYNFYAGGTAPNYFAGQVQLGAGSVGTPSLSVFGDANTGMWFPAADTVAWSTGGSERMRIRSDGNISIGATGHAYINLNVDKSITGAAVSYGVLNAGTVQSDVTGGSHAFYTYINTANAAFTTTVHHFTAAQGIFGASSTVGSQVGFWATSGMVGATNNYGFLASDTSAITAGKTSYGFIATMNIATGGGTAWAFFSNGTAPNYFAGQVQLGAGVVGTPSLSAFGDTNTGMWFPAADTIAWSTGGSERMRIDSNGNVVVNTAAIATTAVNGFLYVPSCAGTPTGTPTAYTGRVPIVVDTTNNKLYFYSGGQWRDAGP